MHISTTKIEKPAHTCSTNIFPSWGSQALWHRATSYIFYQISHSSLELCSHLCIYEANIFLGAYGAIALVCIIFYIFHLLLFIYFFTVVHKLFRRRIWTRPCRRKWGHRPLFDKSNLLCIFHCSVPRRHTGHLRFSTHRGKHTPTFQIWIGTLRLRCKLHCTFCNILHLDRFACT